MAVVFPDWDILSQNIITNFEGLDWTGTMALHKFAFEEAKSQGDIERMEAVVASLQSTKMWEGIQATVGVVIAQKAGIDASTPDRYASKLPSQKQSDNILQVIRFSTKVDPSQKKKIFDNKGEKGQLYQVMIDRDRMLRSIEESKNLRNSPAWVAFQSNKENGLCLGGALALFVEALKEAKEQKNEARITSLVKDLKESKKWHILRKTQTFLPKEELIEEAIHAPYKKRRQRGDLYSSQPTIVRSREILGQIQQTIFLSKEEKQFLLSHAFNQEGKVSDELYVIMRYRDKLIELLA